MAKLTLAISMNAIATASIAGESQKPKLASCEENPPRPMVEKAWMTASSQVIPASLERERCRRS